MRRGLFLRIAALVSLLFATGHSWGGLGGDPRLPLFPGARDRFPGALLAVLSAIAVAGAARA